MSEAIREEFHMDEQYATPEGWVCDSDAKAEWAMKKIREARADRDRMVAWYKKAIETIEKQTDFNTMNLEKMLFEYFQTVPHRKTKTQERYSFPGGKLYLKTQNPEYKRDEKTVIAWLKENGGEQFVKVKEELDWSALKDASGVVDGKLVAGEKVNEDGEIIPIIVPGVEVVEREAKFVVE